MIGRTGTMGNTMIHTVQSNERKNYQSMSNIFEDDQTESERL